MFSPCSKTSHVSHSLRNEAQGSSQAGLISSLLHPPSPVPTQPPLCHPFSLLSLSLPLSLTPAFSSLASYLYDCSHSSTCMDAILPLFSLSNYSSSSKARIKCHLLWEAFSQTPSQEERHSALWSGCISIMPPLEQSSRLSAAGGWTEGDRPVPSRTRVWGM